jgi:putative isomerase
MTGVTRRKMLGALAMAGGSWLGARGSSGLRNEPGPALPRMISTAARQYNVDSLLSYFGNTAPQLLRPAEGILKYPSISPSLSGKQYSTNLWDWDTLWTSRGLFRFANLSGDKKLHSQVGEHAQGSLFNFLDHQSVQGRIPMLVTVTDPDPLGSLQEGSPNIHNQAKPVLSQLALLIADETNDVSWLAPRFDRLLHFYESWTQGNRSAVGLLVWGDDVAIGDDNDPTTFGRPFFSSANLLLNCLFYEDLKAAAKLAERLSRPQDQQKLSAQADQLGASIQKNCWDPRDRFYYTVDVQCVDRRAELIPNVKRGMAMSWQSLPIRVQMFTGFLPLWCGLATPRQAADLVQLHYLADQRFRADWGVRSLSSQETMYSLDFSSNPSNWLGPVWIIVNYLVWKGLKDYGFHDAAEDLAGKTLGILSADLTKNGSLNEYYHPDTGAALSHKGFMDWNLLVLEMI